MRRTKKRTASFDWIVALRLILDTVQSVFNHTTEFLDRSWRFIYSLFKKNPSWRNRYYAMSTILMTALVGFVGISEFKNWELNRVIDMYPLRTVSTAYAYEKTVEVVKTEILPISQIVEGIHHLESGRGTNNNPNALHNICKAQGKSNEYGYGGMRLKICFEDEKTAKARVTLWVVEHLEKFEGNVAMTMCYYNLGQKVNDCEYYQNYLKIN